MCWVYQGQDLICESHVSHPDRIKPSPIHTQRASISSMEERLTLRSRLRNWKCSRKKTCKVRMRVQSCLFYFTCLHVPFTSTFSKYLQQKKSWKLTFKKHEETTSRNINSPSCWINKKISTFSTGLSTKQTDAKLENFIDLTLTKKQHWQEKAKFHL